MRTTSLILAHLFVLMTSNAVLAQTLSYDRDPQVIVSRRVAPPEASHRHSSTAYEGALRGNAALVTAYGDYLQDYSQAAYTWEHVESMRYDNYLKKTATALARKQMLNDYRDYERQRKLNRREEAKQLSYEKNLEMAQKYRLDDFEFNWTTGAIYWPTVAASPRYAHHRQKLEVLMSRVVRYGGADSVRYQNEIVAACNAFRADLKEAAEQDHPSTHDQYVVMQRFLQGLKYAPVLMAQAPADKFLARN